MEGSSKNTLHIINNFEVLTLSSTILSFQLTKDLSIFDVANIIEPTLQFGIFEYDKDIGSFTLLNMERMVYDVLLEHSLCTKCMMIPIFNAGPKFQNSQQRQMPYTDARKYSNINNNTDEDLIRDLLSAMNQIKELAKVEHEDPPPLPEPPHMVSEWTNTPTPDHKSIGTSIDSTDLDSISTSTSTQWEGCCVTDTATEPCCWDLNTIRATVECCSTGTNTDLQQSVEHIITTTATTTTGCGDRTVLCTKEQGTNPDNNLYNSLLQSSSTNTEPTSMVNCAAGPDEVTIASTTTEIDPALVGPVMRTSGSNTEVPQLSDQGTDAETPVHASISTETDAALVGPVMHTSGSNTEVPQLSDQGTDAETPVHASIWTETDAALVGPVMRTSGSNTEVPQLSDQGTDAETPVHASISTETDAALVGPVMYTSGSNTEVPQLSDQGTETVLLHLVSTGSDSYISPLVTTEINTMVVDSIEASTGTESVLFCDVALQVDTLLTAPRIRSIGTNYVTVIVDKQCTAVQCELEQQHVFYTCGSCGKKKLDDFDLFLSEIEQSHSVDDRAQLLNISKASREDKLNVFPSPSLATLNTTSAFAPNKTNDANAIDTASTQTGKSVTWFPLVPPQEKSQEKLAPLVSSSMFTSIENDHYSPDAPQKSLAKLSERPTMYTQSALVPPLTVNQSEASNNSKIMFENYEFFPSTVRSATVESSKEVNKSNFEDFSENTFKNL